MIGSGRLYAIPTAHLSPRQVYQAGDAAQPPGSQPTHGLVTLISLKPKYECPHSHQRPPVAVVC